VWVSNKKIAALGIKARRWVTMHGLAINVDLKSLHNFEGIVPCGLEGREVTCINEEFASGNAECCFTVEQFAVYVREALEEVFGITLVSAPTRL
jgi:lipoyl(octanoyl) transferase